MDIFETIRKRASLKLNCSPREVENEKILQVLEAASLAPSALNNQPWRFLVITSRDNIETVVTKAFGEGNQVVKESPVLILVCAKPADDVIADKKEYYLFDLGLAVENMLLAATDLGLVTHPMAHVFEDELKALLNIPADVRFVIATPLAYPAQGSYDKSAKERLSQRTRKAPKDIFFRNVWGQPF